MDRRMADDLGKLLLRVSVAGMMLLHGLPKLSHGVEGISGMLAQRGIPGFVAYGVYVGEVLAPLLLIVGLGTRVAGVLLAANMVVAIGLAHGADLFVRNPRSGAWAIELQMLYLVAGVVFALIGSGKFAVSKGRGRFD